MNDRTPSRPSAVRGAPRAPETAFEQERLTEPGIGSSEAWIENRRALEQLDCSLGVGRGRIHEQLRTTRVRDTNLARAAETKSEDPTKGESK